MCSCKGAGASDRDGSCWVQVFLWALFVSAGSVSFSFLLVSPAFTFGMHSFLGGLCSRDCSQHPSSILLNVLFPSIGLQIPFYGLCFFFQIWNLITNIFHRHGQLDLPRAPRTTFDVLHTASLAKTNDVQERKMQGHTTPADPLKREKRYYQITHLANSFQKTHLQDLTGFGSKIRNFQQPLIRQLLWRLPCCGHFFLISFTIHGRRSNVSRCPR